MNRLVVIGLLALALHAIPVSAVSEELLRAEIMEYVIDPCYLDSAKRNVVDGISPEEMVPFMKLIAAESIEQTMVAVITLVSQLDKFEDRAVFYVLGQNMCIDSARKAARQ